MTAILLAFAAVTYAPGPANLAVALLAMEHGARAAVRMALGLALGLAAWGVVAALGLGAVLAASETAMTALRLVGGAVLIWLAWRTLRGARLGAAAVGTHRPSRRPGFLTGLLINLSNPKAVLAWLAALAVGLDASGGTTVLAAATLACALIGLSNYLFWALLMSRDLPRRAYARFRIGIARGMAALFGLAGAEMIRQGAAR
jgi:threonine/homoserine/homoserine lactone efflux protein